MFDLLMRMLLIILVVGLGFSTKTDAQRFEKRITRVSLSDQMARCREGDTLTHEQVLKLMAWVRNCKIFDVRKTDSFEYDKYGLLEELHFPVFGYDTKDYPSWRPNVDPIDGVYDCHVPHDVHWLFNCVEGCFSGDQMLQYDKGLIAIEEGLSRSDLKLITLKGSNDDSSIDWQSSSGQTYITDLSPQSQSMLSIIVENGQILRLTPEHILVGGDGGLIRAKNLEIGDSLLNVYNKQTLITAILPSQENIKVYHVTPQDKGLHRHLFPVGEIISGSATLQLAKDIELSRIAFRHAQISPLQRFDGTVE